MIRFRFKNLMRERTDLSETGDELLLSVSEYYGVKPRVEVIDSDAVLARAESLDGYRRVKRDDLVMNYMLAWKGAYGVSDHDGIVSPAYAVFDIDQRKVNLRYLHHSLRSQHTRAQFRAASKGIIESRLRLYPDSFLAQSIDLPDLPTQQAIASFLDRETARIDQLIAKKERLGFIIGERFDELVSQSVTGGTVQKDDFVNSNVSYLGYVPKRWEITSVGHRYQVQLGKMLDSARITGLHLRPYLRVADVHWGRINVNNLPQMDFTEIDRVKFRLRDGDLLVNEGGIVGRSAVWESPINECYYQKAVHRLRPWNAQKDTAWFFYYVMWFAAKLGVFVAGGNQTTIDHLTAETFRRYRFAFPPLDEQQCIADSLRTAEAQHVTLNRKIELSIDRLRELRAALITAAVTGQLDIATWGRHGETDRRLDAIEHELAATPAGVAG